MVDFALYFSAFAKLVGPPTRCGGAQNALPDTAVAEHANSAVTKQCISNLSTPSVSADGICRRFDLDWLQRYPNYICHHMTKLQ